MSRVLRRRYPPPGNRLPSHEGPLSVRLERLLINAGLANLQLAVLRDDPEIDQVFLLCILRIVEFHVGKEAVAVDRAGEIDVVVSELQMLAVERIIEGEHAIVRA